MSTLYEQKEIGDITAVYSYQTPREDTAAVIAELAKIGIHVTTTNPVGDVGVHYAMAGSSDAAGREHRHQISRILCDYPDVDLS